VSNEGKKKDQLGMNPSTARNRLMKVIMHSMAVKLGIDCCFQCGEKIPLEEFSIEHKTPWLDSDNPTELYFDIENIAFSHQPCNSGEARKYNKTGLPKNVVTVEWRRKKRAAMTEEERKADRRERYAKYGN
jgi:hypothetical protein